MTLYEMICFAKLFAVATGKEPKDTLTSQELEIGSEALKKLADQRLDWTKEQKDLYKMLVDAAKELSKG